MKRHHKTLKACHRFLIGKGYDILQEHYMGDNSEVDFVAIDDDTLVFLNVYTSHTEFVDPKPNREDVEALMIDWLADHDECCDMPIRFDNVSFRLIGDDRAIIRHHISIL